MKGLAIASLFLAVAGGMFQGCATAPPQDAALYGERPAPGGERPTAAFPPAGGREETSPRGVPGYDPSRPVRVLLGEEPQRVLAIESAGEIRCWDARGALLLEGKPPLELSAQKERIRLGKGKVVDSPVDLFSPAGMRIGGRKVPGRVRVSARQGKLFPVAVVPLEEYVAAVLSREGSPKFHGEALAALAVAVRSYTVSAMAKPRGPSYDVVSGVEDQVFEGVDGVPEIFRKAAGSTRGAILAWKGTVANTVYHSTCGGRTENAKDAWGADVPYLRSVACGDCEDSPNFRWEYRMLPKEARRVALLLGVRSEGSLKLEITGRTGTGRAARIRISSGGVSRETAAAAFRRAAGYARVKSLAMDIVPVGNGWLFAGKGYGHGVGMCQWGADGMARKGRGSREILARYYPGTVLSGEIR